MAKALRIVTDVCRARLVVLLMLLLSRPSVRLRLLHMRVRDRIVLLVVRGRWRVLLLRVRLLVLVLVRVRRPIVRPGVTAGVRGAIPLTLRLSPLLLSGRRHTGTSAIRGSVLLRLLRVLLLRQRVLLLLRRMRIGTAMVEGVRTLGLHLVHRLACECMRRAAGVGGAAIRKASTSSESEPRKETRPFADTRHAREMNTGTEPRTHRN